MQKDKYDKLRSAWEADSPKPSDDFTEKVMGRIAAEQKAGSKIAAEPKAGGTKVRLAVWRWSMAASFLVVAGVAVWLYQRPAEMERTEAPQMAMVAEDTTAQQSIAEDELGQLRLPEQPKRPIEPKQPKEPKLTTPHRQPVPKVFSDPNLHYASNTKPTDTLRYQPPSRMEDFVKNIAAYNGVEGEALDCSYDKRDTTVVSMAYVFDDTDELKLFSRLLQAACWYDDKTPGYLLNYSHQQFFFRLKDTRLGMKYLWIAERMKGKILLYCTHSPIDVEVSSDCFKEYRDRLTNTSINQNL